MRSARETLLALPADHDAGNPTGMTAVCSAHPLVIAATFAEARETGQPVLIEATCNQVNQEGGYTGMTPADFSAFVYGIAAEHGFPKARIVLGGDHLGPNPWRHLSAAEALEKARVMTRAYAQAGFAKIHLDASMSCADDPSPLPAQTIAERAADLARMAEEGARAGGHPPPAYVIGTEVPVPGGASEALDTLELTTAEDAAHTVALHKVAFADLGLEEALARAIGLVVQPGVEFGSANVIAFAPEKAQALARWRAQGVGILFEAHSTDYQSADALRALVQAGFGLLKVGPGLTFALREALYGLDAIAGVLSASYKSGSLPAAMEALMLEKPAHWQAYYEGDAQAQYFQRHYSYSDRIRYYWTDPAAQKAVNRLLETLQGHHIPEPLISQFMPRQTGVAGGATALLIHAIRTALAPYSYACADSEGADNGQS